MKKLINAKAVSLTQSDADSNLEAFLGKNNRIAKNFTGQQFGDEDRVLKNGGTHSKNRRKFSHLKGFLIRIWG